MRHALFSGIALAVNIVFLPLNGVTQEVPTNLRQSMPYSDAREFILDEGWQIDYQNANSNELLLGSLERLINELEYPEFEDCSGTGMGFCRASFVNAYGESLILVTVNNEEEPTLFRWWIEEEPEQE
ncbi:hypothetical protein [Oscillatoria acuminata]|uniref:Uncharacterized protein n=1 Tax=Oscillatoria acuminata PCC 6304 TaxID=56110 RepID=K9TMW9_9CYAN|nr:hypothetical protein [Oscillatoria acuminata]AFY84207.1 hypothetical protein Oscil6304_4695 [Oscillatoria acuminata PCC 6304]